MPNPAPQCLPTPLAWLASLQPPWLHKLSVAATYIIEIPLTFLFFAPTSSLRKFTALAQAFLMLVIMLSGRSMDFYCTDLNYILMHFFVQSSLRLHTRFHQITTEYFGIYHITSHSTRLEVNLVYAEIWWSS